MRTAATLLAFALLDGALLRAAPQAPSVAVAPAAAASAVTEPPRIDGRLDDGAWSGAAVIADFRQKEPLEGHAGSEATRVRLVYDRTHLYIAAELGDREPNLIRAAELRRDNTLETDDSFTVLLDTYHDHRNAFVFRTNARGTRFDGIVRNETASIDATWDEDWQAVAGMDGDGWVVEMAIPFKILRFSSAADQTWGINFERVLKRRNEVVYWAAWNRNYAFTHVSQAGHLTGLREIRQAERLRVRPYVLAGVEKLDAASPAVDTNPLGDIGIDDLKFAVTSNLTADLAVNPDFAQAEVDAQRVNLTRFNISFPERRQFFIEGADSLKMGAAPMTLISTPVEVVYTRAIGLSEDGEPIPIVAGGKLTGKAGGFDVGLLNVQTGATEARGAENFTVTRVRKELLGRSYLGAIVTNRQGAAEHNRVAGLDGRFVLWKHLNVAGMAAASSDSELGTAWARQAGAEWRADLVEAGLNYVDVAAGFRPGVGFVRRNDRLVGGRFALKPRPGGGPVRQLELSPSAVYFLDPDGVVTSSEAGLAFGMLFHSGERLTGKVENQVERLIEPFEISRGVLLPARRYSFNRAELAFETFDGRRLSGRAEANRGPFFGGDQGSYEFALEYRPGKNFSLESSYEVNDVDLPEGSFVTHLLGMRSNVSFTTTLLASANVQYNSAGSLAVVQLRLNYIFRTIDNFYLVYNETRRTEGAFAGRSNRSLVAKMTYSMHR